jgi:arylsulfatase A-like enzyme
VVFFTDNGGPTAQTTSSNLPLRGAKATTWEGGVRVPFWMQWKGRLPAGKVYEHPVIQLDILPTALAAAGLEAEAETQFDGVNLLPYLEGAEEGPPHESLYWRFGQQWAVRHGDWKLTAARDTQFKPQLFNLAEDISEKQDLTGEHPEKVAELQARWDEWNAGNVPAKWTAPKQQQKRQGQGNRAARRARRAAREAAEAQQ